MQHHSLAIVTIAATLATACTETPPAEPGTAAATLGAYRPFGFARVTASAGFVTRFNSSGGAVTATRTAVGRYRVDFAGLANPVSSDGSRGTAHVTAEGSGNVRCRLFDWATTTTTAAITVECFAADGAAADSAFAIMYQRDIWPTTPNTFATQAAFTRVSSAGAVRLDEDHNSSGTHNVVTRTAAGRYTVRIPNATSANASIIVTPLAGIFVGPLVCGLVDWSGDTGTVECRSHTGVLANNPFTLTYAATGPSMEQQSGHGLFDGTALVPAVSWALGKYAWCSPATITGSRSGSLASITVAGDLGAWDGGAFLRASFATRQGGAGYCKVEALTASGLAPSSTATTTVRCYTSTGAVVAAPVFRFVHTTSDPSGPC